MKHIISAFTTAWSSRFADLPVFPARSILPADDGDVAELGGSPPLLVGVGVAAVADQPAPAGRDLAFIHDVIRRDEIEGVGVAVECHALEL